MNILLLTSCNRIKQTLLSLSLNERIIKEKFGVIIVDSSTPDIDADTMCEQHQSEDPYNVVKVNNYCSDVDLLFDAKKYFTKIEDYKVIHFTPRLNKQRGESTSIGLGLMQASLMGDRQSSEDKNFCLKLTGTSILRFDVLSNLPDLLRESDVVTWHRTNIGGYERSTRVLGCRPEKLGSLIMEEGWSKWCDDTSGVLEQRFAKLLEREIPSRINYTGNDDASVLLEGGMAMQQSYGRERILDFMAEHEIQANGNIFIEEFLNGQIW